MRYLFTTLLVLLFSTSFSQKSTIELTLSVGEVYRQVQESHVDIVQTIQNQDLTSAVSISGTTKFTVIGVHDSLYDMEVLYERLAMKQTTPQGEVSFDSDIDSAAGLGIILHSIKHTPFTLQMSKSGKVVKVNSDNIFAGAIDQFKFLTEEQARQIKEQMKQSFGEKAFKGSFEMFSLIYPTLAVQLGDTWPVKTTLQSIISMDLEGTYQLKDSSDAAFQVHGTTNMINKPTEKPAIVNGLPVFFSLSGRMESDITINKNTGWIEDATVSQTIKGIMKVQDCEQVPGGTEVPVSYLTTTKLSNK